MKRMAQAALMAAVGLWLGAGTIGMVSANSLPGGATDSSYQTITALIDKDKGQVGLVKSAVNEEMDQSQLVIKVVDKSNKSNLTQTSHEEASWVSQAQTYPLPFTSTVDSKKMLPSQVGQSETHRKDLYKPLYEKGQETNSQDDGSILLAHWWTAFDDPTLSKLIELALQNNKQLAAARSRVQQGRYQLGIAESTRLPWLDASGSWTRQKIDATTGGDIADKLKEVTHRDLSVDRASSIGKLGIDASWEIDVFGRQKANVRAASDALQATQADLYATWVSLSAETAMDYMSLRTLQEQLAVVKASVNQQAESLQLLQVNAASGLSSYVPVEQATYELAQTKAQIPAIQEEIGKLMTVLSVLTGTIPGQLDALLSQDQTLPQVNPQLFIHIPANTLRQRPDIQAAERRLATQIQKTKSAKADLRPRFSLDGSIGLESFATGNLFSFIGRLFGIGPSLTMPIFHAGAIRKNIKVQTEKENEYAADYEQTVLTAAGEVRDALLSAGQDYMQEDQLRQAYRSAKEAQRLAQIQFTSGLSNYLGVLDAQRNALAMQKAYINSRGQEFIDVIRLYKALGGGWAPLDQEEAQRAATHKN